MAAIGRRRGRQSANFWPGFVDALSTLVMVVVFVLMIFLVAQFYLTNALSGRDAALAKLNEQVAQLSELLALQEGENADLRQTLAQVTAQLADVQAERDDLSSQVVALLAAQKDLEGALAEAEAAASQAAADLEAANQTVEADRDKIEAQLAELALLTSLRDQLTEEVARLSAALAAAQAEALAAQELHESDLESLKHALAAAEAENAKLKEELAALSQEKSAGESALAEQTTLTEEAKAQIEALNAQLALLRQQLARISVALEASEAKAAAQDIQIANLGERLNQALADKVQELARYRSEFFGRLKEVLGDRQDIRVVGDRFVFQSEVLFDVGQAELGESGKVQLASLATTLKDLTAAIPTDLDWVLQVNGHTDKLPIVNAPFASNWELSAARAISVVKFLIEQGIPPERLAAAGYGEFQPIEAGDTPEAYQANRRIELKLTNR